MSLFPLKPTHKPVKSYYEALATFQKHGHTTEGNTRSAFADLLKKCASPYGWHLVEEYAFKGTAKQTLRADGALIDDFTLQHGIWEAKDSADDLQKEVVKKERRGYPLVNTLFQSPGHAVLYQDGLIAFNGSIIEPEKLIDVLQLFFDHKQPDIPDWKDAVNQFSAKIKELAGAIKKILLEEHEKNRGFRESFESFAELCRQSINPDLTNDAVRNMLVQHLLTERIFRKVFDNEEFLRRNVIAVEIEKVISSITAKHFSRGSFLKGLDHFYKSIERAAEAQTEYTEKQHFLNAVYEKFFQKFDEKQADTMGVVYTPQPIVDFMVRSVDEILQQEFGKSLSDSGVHILDPFTGTGNFITRIMRQIKRSALPQKYSEELHCNEIMLLPYYIASMNIEHAYSEAMDQYRAFEGICLVDTFEVAAQANLFTAENTERIKRQNAAEITLVIGNPPYNGGQEDEADENPNRKYPQLDKKIKNTYIKASKATLTNSLTDPYVRAFRWASDRIGAQGVVCYVTNNSFLDGIAFDGMRQHLMQDFSLVLHVNLKGDARTSGERRRREAGNVFNNQIRVGVGITLLVKSLEPLRTGLHILSVEDYLSAATKTRFLTNWKTFDSVPLTEVQPDAKHTWLTHGLRVDFQELFNLGRDHKGESNESREIFASHSNAPKSNNDSYVYSFDQTALASRAETMIILLEEEHARWNVRGRPKDLTQFLRKLPKQVKWIRRAKGFVKRGNIPSFSEAQIRAGIYRPYNARAYFFGKSFNEDRYSFPRYLPLSSCERENRVICVSGKGSKQDFASLAVCHIPSHDFLEKTHSYPFYTYDKDGTNRRENITDGALADFRSHYADRKITKWEIFHAIYAVLHHPEYRTHYAANLKRELPRIPFPPGFHAFAKAGKRLMELHVEYEKQPGYELQKIEHPSSEISFRVGKQRMKLSKEKTDLRYNEFLTLRGIPPGAFDYRLGNRSALEWVIDQYYVSIDARSGIVNDPNREDDPKYILRLIGQVITVAIETNQLVASLPSLNLPTT